MKIKGVEKMLPPPFVPEEVSKIFEHRIVRAIKEPNLFDKVIAPETKLFLLFGQPGSGMNRALYELTQKHNIEFEEIYITRDTEMVKTNVANLLRAKGHPPLLIIREAHFIPWHRDGSLQDILCDLSSIDIRFIVAISEDPPNDDKHPFWSQFKVRICMPLPPNSFKQELFRFYLEGWTKLSGKSIDADIGWLTNQTTYCTPKDIKTWCHHLFDTIRDEKVEITQDYLSNTDNLLMFTPFGSRDVLCINAHDGSEIQALYDPSCVGSLINQTQSEVSKRSRRTPDDTQSHGFLSGGE